MFSEIKDKYLKMTGTNPVSTTKYQKITHKINVFKNDQEIF